MSTAEKREPAPQLLLILGGARSGKSSFALRLAQQSGRSVAFIATATASDAEMRERIRRHRAERPAHWHTLEEPLALTRAVLQAAALADILLLDCLTLWLANRLLAHGQAQAQEEALVGETVEDEVLTEIEALLRSLQTLRPHQRLIVVSNEVGLGVVPPYPLGRQYRDLLGLANQRLAAVAARVYLMIAGIPLDLKRLQAADSDLLLL